MKRFAPDVPNPKWHRPGDTQYLRELLDAAGLSQRSGSEAIGLKERGMRYKISGESELTYPEQFCLEVLADANQAKEGSNMQMQNVQDDFTPRKVDMYGPRFDPKTTWFESPARPLTQADIGLMVIGKDRFGAPIHGTLIRDGFGITIKSADDIDSHNVPIARVATYTLISPPGQ